MTEQKRGLLNLQDTGVPLFLVGALILGSVSIAITGSRLVARLERLENGVADRWTRQNEVVNALELKIRNPDLHVPDPRDPSQEILIGGR